MARKQVEVTEKKTKTSFFCDICGNEYFSRYTSKTCAVCGRDVCGECSLLSDDLDEVFVVSESPSRYCVDCWGAKEYRDKLNDLVSEFESCKAKIYLEWKENTVKV
jgi:transcription elongation factor Elf1